LIQDLAHAKNDSDTGIEKSPVGSFALPAKRQFSRTKTAFGRLQGPTLADQEMQLCKKVQLDGDSELQTAYFYCF
jgi:hypothetical protein